jgi:hypothetical protein
MKPDNEFMLELTANMPCKQINVNDSPYLQRFYAGKFVNQIGECDLWFHRFLSADGDEHLHWNPMNMRSVVLCGSYHEEYMDDGAKKERTIFPGDASRNFLINFCAKAKAGHPMRKIPCGYRDIGMHDIHRIAQVEPETWSMLLVEPERVPVWGFIDDNGAIETRPTSGRDWWKNYNPRGMNEGDVL